MSSKHCLDTVFLAALLAGAAVAQSAPFVLEREGRVISLEPYAPNTLRVTMSIDKPAAIAAPGYGLIAKPPSGTWAHEQDGEGGVFRSSRMVVHLAPGNLPKEKLPQQMPLDDFNRQLREQYFGSGGDRSLHNDALLVTTADSRNMRSSILSRGPSSVGAMHYTIVSGISRATRKLNVRDA
jgi:alpha-D-xyloside xylohydrolase